MNEDELKELEVEDVDLSLEESTDEFYIKKEIIVDPGQQPMRIDKFLMHRLEQTSRNKIQNAIRSEAVLVENKAVKPNFLIKPGQVITLILPGQESEGYQAHPENIPLQVVYEDEDLMVINKPPGMVVHPGIGNPKGTLVNALAYHLIQHALPVAPGNSADRPGLVHRIDKDTSGLLVIAKTSFAMTHLAKQFYAHTIERTYQALVWGEPDSPSGTIRYNIGRHPRFRLLMETFPEGGEEGKEAVTHYKTIEPMYYVSLIECKLETGRTHQIRVHMAKLGHPVFNDNRYGGDRIRKGTQFSKYNQFVNNCFELLPRHALHAKTLGFIHPTTGKKMEFNTELPEDILACLNKWRHYLQFRKSNME